MGNQKTCPKTQESNNKELEVDPKDRWAVLGGSDLEESLANGWVKLVRADHLVQLADREEILQPCQKLPPEAFVDLGELKRAGSATINFDFFDLEEEWLRVIVVSAPWLSPDHPDPCGDNLRLITEAVQAFVKSSYNYDNENKTYGVLMDFTALPQGERTEEEEEIFKSGLAALSLFYSHPHTIVLKVTTLPDGYPNGYDLPTGANTVPYARRGWCYAESMASCLVKRSCKVLDLGQLPNSPNLWHIMHKCRSQRTPPLHPDLFKMELSKKTFARREVDFDRAMKLYTDAFHWHLGKAKKLDYSGLGWGADDADQLLKALGGNKELDSLNLQKNKLGPEGARWVGVALNQYNSSLADLNLSDNAILSKGANKLSNALIGNQALKTLKLENNSLGDEGAEEFASLLERGNSGLVSLFLGHNSIGHKGGMALFNALKSNQSLASLDLGKNVVGTGAMALQEALQSNSTLTLLNLQRNGLPPECASALAKALSKNSALTVLNLQDNHLGDEGTEALSKVLLSNRSLRRLNLQNNRLTEKCGGALIQALRQNTVLESMDLSQNSLGLEFERSLRKAVGRRACKEEMEIHVSTAWAESLKDCYMSL